MLGLAVPIVLAPLAGGPATVDLAVAVSEAGGLGFLAAGYRSADDLRGQIAETRSRTDRPFGVNVFVPGPPSGPAVDAYAVSLGDDGEVGVPRHDDDDWDAKLALLMEAPPAVVSFVFGLPSADVIGGLRDAGAEVWVTVTTPGEGERALAAGASGLAAQGAEAGGHRGGLSDDGEDFGLLSLLQLLSIRTDAPLVAAGGIASGAGIAAALAAGASLVSIGTGFLRAAEAGTNPAHQDALATERMTALTRAFTGRTARGVVNDFMVRHDEDAPAAYPEVHHLTTPLRAAARERGDAEGFNLWAGQAHSLARSAPAAEIMRDLMAEAREAAQRLNALLP